MSECTYMYVCLNVDGDVHSGLSFWTQFAVAYIYSLSLSSLLVAFYSLLPAAAAVMDSIRLRISHVWKQTEYTKALNAAIGNRYRRATVS